MKWQPIETAPEYGSFLVFGNDGSGVYYDVAWREGDQFVVDIDPSGQPMFAFVKPTHWRPLPKPPKISGRSRAGRLMGIAY